MSELTWNEFWQTDSLEWCHSGVAALESGRLIFGAPESGMLVIIDRDSPQGRLVLTEFTELHGITSDGDRLWIADPGVKPEPSKSYEWIASPGRAASVDFAGQIVLELVDPYKSGDTPQPWRPTSIAPIHAGSLKGHVWVADGYGANLLHLFAPDGSLARTIDGVESEIAFACPHGLAIAQTGQTSLLLVADRQNRRLVRFNLDGSFVDVIANDHFRSPSCIASRWGRTVVTELDGALLEIHGDGSVDVLIDRSPRPEDQRGWPARAGWPNVLVEGVLARPELQNKILNSPHGVAIGSDGDIYVTEWVIGGRFLALMESSKSAT